MKLKLRRRFIAWHDPRHYGLWRLGCLHRTRREGKGRRAVRRAGRM